MIARPPMDVSFGRVDSDLRVERAAPGDWGPLRRIQGELLAFTRSSSSESNRLSACSRPSVSLVLSQRDRCDEYDHPILENPSRDP
jgi:hypothetical protein